MPDFNITLVPKIVYMLRDREQELCHICAVVHAEVSAVALIALVLMTCYLEVMCISVSVGVLYVPN